MGSAGPDNQQAEWNQVSQIGGRPGRSRRGRVSRPPMLGDQVTAARRGRAVSAPSVSVPHRRVVGSAGLEHRADGHGSKSLIRES